MATQAYIGEIRAVSFGYAPRGWMFCNGQLLPIQQNTALFAILGTTYGGNGVTTFALPNLQGIVPLGVSNSNVEGQTGGSYTVALASNQIGHNHLVSANGAANASVAAGNFPGASPPATGVYGASANTTMHVQTVSLVGNSLPHNNQQPYLVVNYIICVVGLFPSRN